MINEQIQQIGERLAGLREVMDITVEEMAAVSGISEEEYLAFERGERELAVSCLMKISKRYDISLDVLLFGEEPHMKSYYVTRCGQGASIERRKEYKYQSLAAGFRDRKADIFLTRVDPLPEGRTHGTNTHEGQEFNYLIEGRLEITVGAKTLILNAGDSIYFDAGQPHCMRALDGQPAQFLAVVI